MLYYRTRRWSFRELPLRVSCFDSLYRNELSGVASGALQGQVVLAGRRPHLRRRGAGGGRGEGDDRPDGQGLQDLRPRVQAQPLDDARRPHGHEGVLGEGGGDPRPRHGGEGAPVQGEGEGRGVLRPKDRRGHQGLDGEGVAELDHPARLPASAEVQADLRRLGREGAHPGRDTPRHTRLAREVHRGLHRARAGEVPRLDRPRAGEGPARLRREQGIRGEGRGDAGRARDTGREGLRERHDRRQDQGRAAPEDPLHAGDRLEGGAGAARSRSGRGTGTSGTGSSSTTSSPRSKQKVRDGYA